MSDSTIAQLVIQQASREQSARRNATQPEMGYKWLFLILMGFICASFLAGVEHGMDKRQETVTAYCKSLSIFAKNPLCLK